MAVFGEPCKIANLGLKTAEHLGQHRGQWDVVGEAAEESATPHHGHGTGIGAGTEWGFQPFADHGQDVRFPHYAQQGEESDEKQYQRPFDLVEDAFHISGINYQHHRGAKDGDYFESHIFEHGNGRVQREAEDDGAQNHGGEIKEFAILDRFPFVEGIDHCLSFGLGSLISKRFDFKQPAHQIKRHHKGEDAVRTGDEEKLRVANVGGGADDNIRDGRDERQQAADIGVNTFGQ